MNKIKGRLQFMFQAHLQDKPAKELETIQTHCTQRAVSQAMRAGYGGWHSPNLQTAVGRKRNNK